MPKVKVDHKGACESKETGQVHSFEQDEAVELPQDVVDALGDHATPVKEKKQVEEKEVKDAKNTNVKKAEVVTK